MSVYTVSKYLRHVVPKTAGWRPPEWTELAVCAEVGTDLWYPELEEGGLAAEPAKALCRSCEVRITCLREALSRPGEQGVWGGFSERVRNGRVAREHAAGKSLEDIIADDDARWYARTEANEAAIAARGGTYEDRRAAIQEKARQANRQAVELATSTKEAA